MCSSMRLSVFGLGYVGTVSAACFAHWGHGVVGVDCNQTKVEMLNNGQSPIFEAKISELICAARDRERLAATMDARAAVLNSDIALICVGTPSRSNGDLDLNAVRAVGEEIGRALRERNGFFVVVLRSTVLPGTTQKVLGPILEETSGKCVGRDFGLCFNPEFLREGTAVDDFLNPPRTVIGASDRRTAAVLHEIYDGLAAPFFETEVEVAELLKYADNAWHATKICFANEIGNICKAVGVDGHRVMEIFCADKKLNLSAKYLKPGFAFGGSCLPKDIRALTYAARRRDLDVPVLNALLSSNQHQINAAMSMILEQGKRHIGILGLSFKAGTDDLRESPMVEVVERLLGKGYEVCVFDRNVSLATLTGANRQYLMNHIPHISRLLVETADQLVARAEVVVIGQDDPLHRQALHRLQGRQVVVDLVRVSERNRSGEQYHGICW